MNKDKADTAFSIYVRKRDANEDGICTCITCKGRWHWSELGVGHYEKRDHINTRWHEKNVHPQCNICNGQEEHKKEIKNRHAWELKKLYGPGVLVELRQKRNSRIKWTQYDVDLTERYYKQKANELQVA